jgi:hypothetical protein
MVRYGIATKAELAKVRTQNRTKRNARLAIDDFLQEPSD